MWAHDLPKEELIMLLAVDDIEADEEIARRQTAGLRSIGAQ